MKQFAGRITLDTGLAATGFLAFVLTYGFPSMSFKGVDAALVPRVWASLLVALAVARLVADLQGRTRLILQPAGWIRCFCSWPCLP